MMKNDSTFLKVDSARIDTVTPVNSLKVPYYPIGSVPSDYGAFRAKIDAVSNVQYLTVPLYDVFFNKGYDIDSNYFGVTIGPKYEDFDEYSPNGGTIIGYKRTWDCHYHDWPPILTETTTLIAGAYQDFVPNVFPIVGRDLWLERKLGSCGKVGGLSVADLDGRVARLRWQGGWHGLYEVAFGEADSSVDGYAIYQTSDTAFEFPGMVFGTRYACRVRGRCCVEDTMCVWSEWSDTFQFERHGFYLTLLSSDDRKGSVYGSGYYEPHTDVTVEAFANEGYAFLAWSDSVADNPRTVTVDSDTSFAAVFGDAGDAGFAVVGDERAVTVYPNPACGMVAVSMGGLAVGGATVTVMDVTGREMMSRRYDAGDEDIKVIDISRLHAGTYLMQITTNSDVFIEKLIVK